MQDLQEMTIPVETDGDMTADAAHPADTAVGLSESEKGGETAPPSEENGLSLSREGDAYLPVYNGEVRPIRADDRQEITTLLQLGMKQRDFLPQYERLSRLAADHGDRSVKALIDRLCETDEKERLEKAVSLYGEEDGRRFYELELAERTRRYEETVRQQQDDRQTENRTTAHRLAEEFVALQHTDPTLHDIRQLPREVIETAVVEGISLVDAHNRFVLAQQQRVEAQAALERDASLRSTGSLSQNGETPPSAMEAFISGLHSRTG